MQALLLLVVFLILLLNVLFGLIRGLNRSVVRLGTLVLAAVGAFFLARWLGGVVGEKALTAFETSLLSNPEFAAALQDAPEIKQAVVAIVHMLVAPILFLILYPILKLITLIVYRVVLGCFMIEGPKNAVICRLGGALVGICTGLIGAIVFLTPVLGYTETVSHALSVIGEGSTNEDEDSMASLYSYNEEFLASAADAPLVAPLHGLASGRLFTALTTVSWNEQEVSLESEMDAILSVGTGIKSLSEKPIHAYGAAEQAALARMSRSVSESPMLSSLATGTLRSASQAWLDGRTFINISRPEASDNGDVVLNAFLEVFSTETTDTLTKDLSSFSELFGLLVKHDLFALLGEETEQGAFVDKLAVTDILAETEALVAKNPRMQPVTEAFTDVGMRLLVRELGLPADYAEEHPELMEQMAVLLRSSVENDAVNEETFATDLKGLMLSEQIPVTDSAIELIAGGFSDLFTVEELETLTTEQIAARMIERLEAADTAAARISSAAGDSAE
ncbi:MAG: hypothetical protein IJA78_01510 [Clostridia bacterium]|nr:hypothetical protein [Clostridia bacterium]